MVIKILDPDTVSMNLDPKHRIHNTCVNIYFYFQAYHGELRQGESTSGVLERVQGEYHSLPHVPGTAPQLRFSHLVGYGARYYSYLLARSVASAIWQKNFQKDPYAGAEGKR